MRVRVRIASVLARGERPFVDVIFDEEAFRLTTSEARRACDWMAFAVAWLASPPAFELGDAIERALDTTAAQPARRVEDHVLGALRGQLSSGEPAWLELSVQSGVREAGHPRIQLAIGESLAVDEEPFYGDTWWINSNEAAELASLVRAGAGSLADFLHVRTTPDPEHQRVGGVELRFADSLLEEQGDDGVFWMSHPDARRVADWLDAAIDHERKHPAHVWVAPEPDPITVAELDLTRTRT